MSEAGTSSKATGRSVAAAEPITTDLTAALEQIKQIAEEASAEAAKVQLGVKAAGPRFRAKIKSINAIVKQAVQRSLEIRATK